MLKICPNCKKCPKVGQTPPKRPPKLMPKPLKTRFVCKMDNLDVTWYLLCSRPIGPPRNLTFSCFWVFILHCIPDTARVTTYSTFSGICSKMMLKWVPRKVVICRKWVPWGVLRADSNPKTFFYAWCYTFLQNVQHLWLFCEFVLTFAAQCPKLSRTLARRYTGLPAQY